MTSTFKLPDILPECAFWVRWLETPALDPKPTGWRRREGIWDIAGWSAVEVSAERFLLAHGPNEVSHAVWFAEPKVLLLVLGGALYRIYPDDVRSWGTHKLIGLIDDGSGGRLCWTGEEVVWITPDGKLCEIRHGFRQVHSVSRDGEFVSILGRYRGTGFGESELRVKKDPTSEKPRIKVKDISQAHDVLQHLVGLPLTGMARPIGQDFYFGGARSQRLNGQTYTNPEYSLDFHDRWWVEKAGRPVLCWEDFQGWRSEAANSNELYDRIDTGDLLVEAVDVGPLGELNVKLSDGFIIRSEPWVLCHDLWYSFFAHWVFSRRPSGSKTLILDDSGLHYKYL